MRAARTRIGVPESAIMCRPLQYKRGQTPCDTRMCRGNMTFQMTHWEGAMGKVYRFRLHDSHPNFLQPLDRVFDLLDGPCAGLLDCAASDPSQRVVVNAGAGGNHLPGPVTLAPLQLGNDLIESHESMLGVHALNVKAFAPSGNGHSRDVEKPLHKSAFRDNLVRLIGDESVNAWAKRHELEQTTIQRIYSGKSDPKLSMIEAVAAAVNAKPWQLMAPGFQLNNQPVILARVQDLHDVSAPAPAPAAAQPAKPARKISRQPAKAARAHAR